MSVAPFEGYSATGRLELIQDHIYVAKIYDPARQEIHYAKFGVVDIKFQYPLTVNIVWAYQLIPGLPELKAPDLPRQLTFQPAVMRF